MAVVASIRVVVQTFTLTKLSLIIVRDLAVLIPAPTAINHGGVGGYPCYVNGVIES